MEIAIIEDLESDSDFLQNGIRNYCKRSHIHATIHPFYCGQDFLNSFQPGLYQLIFLDVYLGDMEGTDIAAAIRAQDSSCVIIFCTTSQDFAVKAFRVRALDYLVKPFTYDELDTTLSLCQKEIKKISYYIEVKESRNYTKILVSDIIYTDYYNHYIQIHTDKRMIRSYMPFADFEPMLGIYPQFLCCYRNCLVNMDYIEAVDEKDFILKNKERIPIARGRKREIIQAYADYTFDCISGGALQ